MKGRLPFARGLSLDFYSFISLAFRRSVSYFFLYRSKSLSLWTVLDAILSNIDEILSVNPFTSAFDFVDFNVHYKEWLTCSCWTCRAGELYYNFSISILLTQMVSFPTLIRSCDTQISALLHLFLLTQVFVLGFPYFGQFWSCLRLSFY